MTMVPKYNVYDALKEEVLPGLMRRRTERAFGKECITFYIDLTLLLTVFMLVIFCKYTHGPYAEGRTQTYSPSWRNSNGGDSGKRI